MLQTLYTLSDDQTEYQIRDRLSLMRFVGLALEDRVPDAKTIWLDTSIYRVFPRTLRTHGRQKDMREIVGCRRSRWAVAGAPALECRPLDQEMTAMELYAALDVSLEKISVCILDRDGQIVLENSDHAQTPPIRRDRSSGRHQPGR